jgi:hypothetical protein
VKLVEARLERGVDREAIGRVREGVLDRATLLKLNPQADVGTLTRSARQIGFLMVKPKKATSKETSTPRARATPRPAERAVTKVRRAGEAAFTVSVHDNRVELLVHGEPVASTAVSGPEFYGSLFRDVKARIEKGEP